MYKLYMKMLSGFSAIGGLLDSAVFFNAVIVIGGIGLPMVPYVGVAFTFVTLLLCNAAIEEAAMPHRALLLRSIAPDRFLHTLQELHLDVLIVGVTCSLYLIWCVLCNWWFTMNQDTGARLAPIFPIVQYGICFFILIVSVAINTIRLFNTRTAILKGL